jgi:GcrA cell cycle regulator
VFQASHRRAFQGAEGNTGDDVVWTKERKELVTKLWADGLSASQIAYRVGGVTRNAVIGVIHRMGLPGRATTLRLKSHRPRRRKVGARLAPRPIPAWKAQLRAEPYIVRPEPVIPPEERKPILVRKDGRLHANDALTNKCCRYPVGDPQDPDFGFCGRPKEDGISYCLDHARIAFNAQQPKGVRPLFTAAPSAQTASSTRPLEKV